ncbi:PAS domain-containing protein [candidate division KSB1 bacterium]|nr:PAS domain-containing protein [candidate division KSB1 bacterium]
MRSIWKPVFVTVGALAILAGTLLLMGNIQNVTRIANSTEFSKLQTTALSWSAGLETCRSAVREQVLRQELLRISERPGEWVTWRAAEKYRAFLTDWNASYGPPRALCLIVNAAQLHSFEGDTSGLAMSLKLFEESGNPEITIFGGNASTPGFVAIQYRYQQDSAAIASRWITLFDPTTVLRVGDTAPHAWTLMSGPDQTLFSSSGGSQAACVSPATWPLIIGQQKGALPGTNDDQWGFVKLQLPGMKPVLLLASLTPPGTASHASIWWIAAGLLVMIVVAVWPYAPNPLTAELAPPLPEPGEPAIPSSDATAFRQLFQAIVDPLCIVEVDGRFSRSNHAAQEMLRIQRGKPDPALNMEHGDLAIPAAAFFQQLAAGAIDADGPVRLATTEKVVFSGRIRATRLYVDQDRHGPLLLQFVHDVETAPTLAIESVADEDAVPVADPLCPNAIIVVSRDGLLQNYNDAALAICPTLENSPMLTDIFPALDRIEVERILRRENTSRFETLFGSGTFEFHACPHNGTVVLYGSPAAAEKQLEIALAQAHENFNTLCNMTPAAVLFLNVHDHNIQQCNVAACDLFSMPAPGLLGRTLESLSAFPWIPSSEPESEFFAATPDGRTIRCKFACELVKIEGEPTMLAVLDPIATYQPVSEQEQETRELLAAVDRLAQDEDTPPNTAGPGLLIVSNPVVRDVARKLLERAGHDVEAFTTLDDATVWVIAHQYVPGLITLDVTDFDDVEDWLANLRARCGSVPCLAITDGETHELPNSGENFFLQKPFDLDDVERALHELGVEATAHA